MTKPTKNIQKMQFKKCKSQVLVAHTCNPGYSGGRDQENCGLKSTWANSLRDLSWKMLNTKQGWYSGSSGRAPA
jgi:hypothetical protein